MVCGLLYCMCFVVYCVGSCMVCGLLNDMWLMYMWALYGMLAVLWYVGSCMICGLLYGMYNVV